VDRHPGWNRENRNLIDAVAIFAQILRRSDLSVRSVSAVDRESTTCHKRRLIRAEIPRHGGNLAGFFHPP
jgi:hypothetical protein